VSSATTNVGAAPASMSATTTAGMGATATTARAASRCLRAGRRDECSRQEQGGAGC